MTTAAPRITRDPASIWRRLLQVCGLALMVFGFEQNLEAIARDLRLHPTAGTLTAGADLRFSRPGVATVAVLPPSAALAKAGVRQGDKLLFDDPLQRDNAFSTRSPVSLIVVRDGVHRRITVLPTWLGGRVDVADVAIDASVLVCVLLAGMLLWRGASRVAPLALGIALAAFASPSPFPEPLLATQPWRTPAALLAMSTYALSAIAFLAFAVRLKEIAIGRPDRASRIAAALAISFSLICMIDRLIVFTSGGLPLLFGDDDILFVMMSVPPLGVTLAIIVSAWLNAPVAMRQRYTILLAGLAVMVVGQAFAYATEGVLLPYNGLTICLVLVGTNVIGPALLTYAILRQRVMDVGFAINRTLVYGAVSLVVLVAFGVVEWAVEHFAPVAGRESYAVVDAALALAVYLAFHRIHGAAEHLVERLFFHSWQEREAGLRQFLSEAPHFTRSGTLIEASVAALQRFAEDVPTSMYLRREDGDYDREAGWTPALEDCIGADERSLIRLRAEQRPVRMPFGDDAAELLFIPMTSRGDLVGCIVLSGRPEGDWRPDQLDLLSVAAQAIGKDLQTLELAKLRTVTALLTSQLELLEAHRLSPAVGADTSTSCRN